MLQLLPWTGGLPTLPGDGLSYHRYLGGWREPGWDLIRDLDTADRMFDVRRKRRRRLDSLTATRFATGRDRS